MKRYYIFIVLLFVLCSISCSDVTDYSLNMNTNYPICDNIPLGNGQKTKVIILLGQSNASGCSIVEYLKLNTTAEEFNKYEQGFNNIYINYCIDDHLFSSNGKFVNVDLTCGCGNGFFGPEVGMSEILSSEFSNETIFILKYTMSGYSLNHHWLNNRKRGDIYDACIKYLYTYLDFLITKNYNISVDAICWMQGESDTTNEKGKLYYNNQKAFVSYLRSDLAKYNQNIYFIDAGISSSPYCLPAYDLVNDAKFKFSELSELNIYFSTIANGLTTLYEPDYDPDLGHYDSLSEIKLGHLFAQEIVKIYKK